MSSYKIKNRQSPPLTYILPPLNAITPPCSFSFKTKRRSLAETAPDERWLEVETSLNDAVREIGMTILARNDVKLPEGGDNPSWDAMIALLLKDDM